MSTFYEFETNGHLNFSLEWKTLLGPKLKKGSFSYKIKIVKNELSKQADGTVSMMIGILNLHKDTDFHDSLNESRGISFSSGVNHVRIHNRISLKKRVTNSEIYNHFYRENSKVELYGEYLDNIICLGFKIDDKDFGILVEADPKEIDPKGEEIYVGFSAGYYALSTIFELYNDINLNKMLNYHKSLDLHLYFE